MGEIERLTIRSHSKASEKYVDVIFNYAHGRKLSTSIPIEYRRTGTQIEDDQLDEYLFRVYQEVDPSLWTAWRSEQEKFWKTKPRAQITKSFFDVLATSFEWCCVKCSLPPNSNPARRIQDIKEFGFTLATDIKRACAECNQNTTQLILVPIRRGGITGYETWSPQLRNRIISVLGLFDSFEAKPGKKEGLLPDHKFPEIRWDAQTRRESLEGISEEEIIRDFQLLSNQRNQQKREVCRKCFQTGNRGVLYGIPFFYQGKPQWDQSIPASGKAAEQGCVGCAWYDINLWRSELAKKIK